MCINKVNNITMSVKLFVEGQGEFGSALTRKAINHSLPSTHYIYIYIYIYINCHHFLLNIYFCLIWFFFF